MHEKRSGLCECGCGQAAPIATQTNRSKGWVKGQPLRFVRGHAGKRHGHSSQGRRKPTPTYYSWDAMMRRCSVASNDSYRRDYIERGIAVCERWHSFENFLADMGERPDGTSLDRINGDRGYEPGNCRWATIFEQNRNRRGVSADPGRCPHGHEMTGENLIVRPDGRRVCRQCKIEGNRRYRERKRAAG